MWPDRVDMDLLGGRWSVHSPLRRLVDRPRFFDLIWAGAEPSRVDEMYKAHRREERRS